MKQRIITAIVLLILFLPCVIFGGIPFIILMSFIGVMATFELLSICHNKRPALYTYLVLGIFILVELFYGKSELIDERILFVFLIVLLTLHIFDERITFDRLSYYFTASTLVSAGLHMVYFLRLEYGLSMILYLAFATLGADTGAYFVGVAIGKHKLCPRLSPKKTIEGSVGGIIIGGTLAIVYALVSGLKLPLIPIILFAFILSTTGQIGDLTFSSIKRYFEVKDYSQIFPGHGGVLDRFDSIIFNAMVLGLLLNILTLI